jgi:hypothetical protein
VSEISEQAARPGVARAKGAAAASGLLFSGGPPQGFESRLGLLRGAKPHFVRRALFTVTVGWLPLALLTAVRGDFVGPDAANSFLADFGVHCRFLLAAPLLVLAEAICVPRLAAIARQFIDCDLVSAADRGRYDAAVTSSQRLMNSRVVEAACAVLAYAIVFGVVKATPASAVPSWHGLVNPFVPTLAGWWGLVVSLPLLLVLLLGWLWRICVWARFLWLMNRLQLQLEAAHPDRAGGVGFLGTSLEAFLPIGFIVGVICAGPVANQVVHRHVQPLQFKSVALGAAVVVAILCAAPLLVFLRRLLELRSRGALQYGALALHMDRRFRLKWVGTDHTTEGTPDMSDFTGTNAANSIAVSARAVQVLPLDMKSVGLLLVTTLLPFVPVWLLAVPFTEVAKKLSAFLL